MEMCNKIVLCVWIVSITFLGCERVDFDENEKKGTDTTEIKKPESDSMQAYSIVEAQELYERVIGDTVIKVAGYIVGVSGQFSLLNSVFEVPFLFSSNILLADSPYERNYLRCMPIRLKNGSDERSELNLVDHPENLGKALLIEGCMEEYYRVPGIKNPSVWSWIEIISPTDTIDQDNPLVVDSSREIVYGGRGFHLHRIEGMVRSKSDLE